MQHTTGGLDCLIWLKIVRPRRHYVINIMTAKRLSSKHKLPTERENMAAKKKNLNVPYSLIYRMDLIKKAKDDERHKTLGLSKDIGDFLKRRLREMGIPNYVIDTVLSQSYLTKNSIIEAFDKGIFITVTFPFINDGTLRRKGTVRVGLECVNSSMSRHWRNGVTRYRVFYIGPHAATAKTYQLNQEIIKETKYAVG